MTAEDNVIRLPERVRGPAVGGRSVPGLLDINQAAERLNVSPRFIRRLIEQRRIDHLKIGKFIRFEPADLEVWIEHHRVERGPFGTP